MNDQHKEHNMPEVGDMVLYVADVDTRQAREWPAIVVEVNAVNLGLVVFRPIPLYHTSVPKIGTGKERPPDGGAWDYRYDNEADKASAEDRPHVPSKDCWCNPVVEKRPAAGEKGER